ncbi:nucleotidyl transferase AbiEii/AbiGii toxin family protein [Defluviimonas salinarum]|uniref:Nucleotidyl transferase AbiEii/AbiGii toxin family protein n=1 Tax=Defluviimonas salinarum TaxID=2992147 RepID=A0ABT3J923_9RHOB|nr:nucleotidyl transferase AbiEii/AbiGii toxin family protein [Defluviimonas salinarum]MCW3784183.1 nucleotidyl transferase AbiEii/AbiGii toxin family protein [Defluviimonas salinarum]
MFAPVSFRRDHHNAILEVLRSLDGEFFARSKCYFGGGTAIVLELDEYRESVDVDFLCADREGYRDLRSALAGASGLDRVLRPGADLEVLREVRADQYGIRTFIRSQGVTIKFEILREARIGLDGEVDPRFGVPVLSRELMFAEKLLANSDRWYAPEVLSRDILDLSVMILRWGDIPERAWIIAEEAYGVKAREDFALAVGKIRNPDWIGKCAKEMAIDQGLVDEILALHGGPTPRHPSPFD